MKHADIQKLHDAGLITGEQRQKIIGHFQLKEDSGGKFLAIVSVIGAVLIAAGIALLISAHWNEIPRGVKIAAGLALMLGGHGFGWWLREAHGQYRKLGEALHFLSSCLFLANIALITQLQPNESSSWLGRGEMLEGLKRYDDALKDYDKAVALDAKNGDAWNDRGGLLLQLGKYDEAIKSYNKAIEVYPKQTDSFYYRACAYAQTGDKTKALADLKTAIQRHPSFKAQAAKEDHFKSLRADPDFQKLTE